jgi:hypothetical protein
LVSLLLACLPTLLASPLRPPQIFNFNEFLARADGARHAVGINYLRGKSKRLFASPAKKSTKILAPVSPLLDKLFHKRPGRNLEDDEGKMDVLRPEAPSKKKTLEAFTRRSSVDGLPPLRKPSPTSGAGIRRCSSSPMSCNDDVREDIKKAFEV